MSMSRQYPLVALLTGILLLCLGADMLPAQQQISASYTKLAEDGRELPREAQNWAMVRDNATGLIWEVKTTDGSLHDVEKVFDWTSAQAEFIAELNRTKFGGFDDWRLPTTDELRTLAVKGEEPYINREFFPHTAPTSYLSWRKCGSGEIFDERIKFGEQRNGKKDRRVRAVRNSAARE
jgi:hypothetical protein